MTAHLNGRNGTEALLCKVTVVQRIAAFLRQCLVLGEGFESKYKKHYFSWEITDGFAVWRPLFARFLVLFLQLSACNFPFSEVKNRRYRVFLSYVLAKFALKRVPKKNPNRIFCSKLSSAKSFAQSNHFHFYNPFFFFKFWVLGELQRVEFGF